MSKRNAEIISKEISKKILKRNELMNAAKEIVIEELKKNQYLSYEVNEEDKTVSIKGNLYASACLDLEYWYGQVRESDSAEYLARDMMEDIKNQLLPERDYSM